MSLRDKIIIITGAGQGIGRSAAEAFAREGAVVVIAEMDREAGEEQAQRLHAQGHHTAQFVPCDVGEEGDIQTLVAAVVELHGRVDVLINNAGMNDVVPIQERSTARWDRVLNVCLRGPYLCARHALPHMPRGSAIINIASTRAFMSEPDTESYSAAKGGLVSLTHSLAMSLGDNGIRVNCISPGWIDVSRHKKAGSSEPEELRAQDHQQHPVGRVGVPEDIAQTCLYLADGEKSGFITGQNFIIDGGMTKKMIYL